MKGACETASRQVLPEAVVSDTHKRPFAGLFCSQAAGAARDGQVGTCLGAQRDLHRVGQPVHSLQHEAPGVHAEAHVLGRKATHKGGDRPTQLRGGAICEAVQVPRATERRVESKSVSEGASNSERVGPPGPRNTHTCLLAAFSATLSGLMLRRMAAAVLRRGVSRG